MSSTETANKNIQSALVSIEVEGIEISNNSKKYITLRKSGEVDYATYINQLKNKYNELARSSRV